MILPDLAAGCSMADMAAIGQVEDAWDELRRRVGVGTPTRPPVTYMNSSAAIKAFTGRHGGTICTSSNAQTALTWAFDQIGGVDGTGKVLLPARPAPRPQHRGPRARPVPRRLRAVGPAQAARRPDPASSCETARMILWRGHCSVHGRFTVEAVDAGAARHPRCQGHRAPRVPATRSCELADDVGSTEKIIKTHRRGAGRHRPGRSAPSSTSCAGSREQYPRQAIAFLEKNVCYCSTMNRIDLPHLVWALESLVDGRVVNPIRVDPDVAHWARVALDQMLALPGETAKD